jgi:hypothetical protein
MARCTDCGRPTSRLEWRPDEVAAVAARAQGLVESAEVRPFLVFETDSGVEHAIRITHEQAMAYEAEGPAQRRAG